MLTCADKLPSFARMPHTTTISDCDHELRDIDIFARTRTHQKPLSHVKNYLNMFVVRQFGSYVLKNNGHMGYIISVLGSAAELRYWAGTENIAVRVFEEFIVRSELNQTGSSDIREL